MNLEHLRDQPLFSGLADAELAELAARAELMRLAPGAVLVAEGDAGDCLYLTLTGRFEVTKRAGDRELVIAARGPGEVIGELALVEGSQRSATVRALDEARVLKISRETFEQVLLPSPGAALRLLRIMMERLRNTEQALRQSEKLAALGTLAAGLAHELNNPAAAMQRGAANLRVALADLQRLAADLAAADLTPEQRAMLNRLRRELPLRATAGLALDPLARSDLESEAADWLAAQDVDDGWELAPAIVRLGWVAADLQEFSAPFAPAGAAAFLGWLAAGCNVYALVDEISEGSARVSEIVRAVKSYTYLDQAPVQLCDIHEGLENTLIILRHKLKHGITVHRDYAADLPRIEAYAGELNQAWTNIIDNAIDAMDGRGDLWLSTRGEPDRIIVSIGNSGLPIPPAALDHIFDAFFTTKEPGKGTGLGLNITYNIIVNQHRGHIAVDSQPARTTFTVTLPVQVPR